MKFCPYCGSGLDQDMRFCPQCGMLFEGGKENPNLANQYKGLSSPSVDIPKQTTAGRRKSNKKHRGRIVLLIVFLILITIVIGSYIFRSIVRKPFTDDANAIAKAAQSVVKFSCYDEEGELFATGSGFAAFENGVIVTNYHVIEDAFRISAQLESGASFDCPSVLTYDSEKDIAILKSNKDTGLMILPFGSSNNLKKGAKVVAIGSPLGLINTVSTGIYSGIVTEKGIDFLQFSASISSGSSGGALFNESGEVIGVTSASYIEGQNLNLAIPIEQVIDLWDNRNTGAMLSIEDFYNRTSHIRTYNISKMLSNPESYPRRLFETCKIKGYVSSIEYSGDVPWLIYLVNELDQVSGNTIGKVSNEQDLTASDDERNPDEDAVHSYAISVQFEKYENIENFSIGDHVCVTGALSFYPDNIGRVFVLNADELMVLK